MNTTQILMDLVDTNTAQPAGNEALLCEYIDKLLPSHFERTYFEHTPARHSMIVMVPGQQDIDGLAFVGHLDTVAAGQISSWQHPPFCATVHQDKLYGRGSSDMKSGVAAMVHTALSLAEDAPLCNTYFCFTADEEAGGMGVLAMVQSGQLKNVQGVIICEPSDGKIGIGEKGALWLEVESTGKLSHGSRPDLGVNAVEKSIEFVQVLKDTINFELNSPLLGNTTMALTKLNGGVLNNVVPDKATLCVDIRTVFGIDHQQIIDSAKEIAQQMQAQTQGLFIQIEVANNRPAIEIEQNHPFVQRVKHACLQNGASDQCRGMYFYTDGSQLIPAIQKPFVILGPGDDAMAHQKDEFVCLQSVATLADIYLCLAKEI